MAEPVLVLCFSQSRGNQGGNQDQHIRVALVIPSRHPSHALSLKQLWGNTCSSDPPSLMEMVSLLLGCASDGDADRNSGPFTLHVIQLH